MNKFPHTLECEQYVIGCCLSEPVRCVPESQIVIKSPDYFYDLRNQTIWETIISLPSAEVEIVSVHQSLKNRQLLESIGGIAYLNQCQDVAASSANLSVWLKQVEDKKVLRDLISQCDTLSQKSSTFAGSVVELLDEAERGILAIRPNQRKTNDIKSLVNLAINRLEDKFNQGNKIGGLSTGLPDLDKLSDGLHAGEMLVIAGFPSTGKTALAVNIAVTNALGGVPVAIFTAEMLPVQIVVRSLCATARANAKHLVESDIASLTSASARLSRAPIHVEAASGLTAGQVMAMARRLKQSSGIKVVVVDYIQLLTGTGDNREQQVSSISKAMKAMALELDCTVIALSQLTDDGKMRESRAISQDADSIWKLENDGAWQPKIQPINLNIEKCRDGETGQVELTFMKQYTKFESATRISEQDIPHYENH